MLLFSKSSSRTVHHYPDQESGIEINNYYSTDDIDNQRCCSTSVTVWSKSLVFGCNGFTVIGSDGSLVYRVDNYSENPNQILLMDGSGNPIFTICRRKKLRLIDDYWLVYNGEVGKYCDKSSRKPIFCAKKNVNILKTKQQSAIAYVYNDGSTASAKRCTYMIEGSYKHRSCKILDETRQVVGNPPSSNACLPLRSNLQIDRKTKSQTRNNTAAYIYDNRGSDKLIRPLLIHSEPRRRPQRFPDYNLSPITTQHPTQSCTVPESQRTEAAPINSHKLSNVSLEKKIERKEGDERSSNSKQEDTVQRE